MNKDKYGFFASPTSGRISFYIFDDENGIPYVTYFKSERQILKVVNESFSHIKIEPMCVVCREAVIRWESVKSYILPALDAKCWSCTDGQK